MKISGQNSNIIENINIIGQNRNIIEQNRNIIEQTQIICWPGNDG